jgi:hypothetical protein
MGIFVVNWADSETVELEALANNDVMVCSAVLNRDEASTSFAVGDSRFDAKGANMTMVFVPQHETISALIEGGASRTSPLSTIILQHFRGLPTQLPPGQHCLWTSP